MKDRWDWKILRMKKNITLREISNELCCSIAHVSKYENDKGEMIFEKVRAYKDYIKNYKK